MSFLDEFALKSLLLLTLVSLVALVLRKSTPAVRHGVWALGFVTLALMPLMRAWLPTREVVRSVEAPVQPPVAVAAPEPKEPPTQFAVEPPPSPITPVQVPTEPAPPREFPWSILVLSVWTLGSIVLATRLAHGLWLTRRLLRSTRVAESGAGDAARSVGLQRPPLVRVSSEIDVPMTLGFVRPVVLLPESASEWSSTTRRAVLLHECAHIRRNDWALLVLAKLLCAVYWFNPLVWWAMSRMRIESEAAADDLVLLSGINPATYAEQLLALAEGLHRSRLAVNAIAIVEPGTLRGRIEAVLGRARRGGALSRRVVMSSLAIGLLLVSVIACTKVVSHVAPSVTTVTNGVADLGHGHKLTLEAVTAMIGQKALTRNRNGALLPEPLPIDKAARDTLFAKPPMNGSNERYLFFTTDMGADTSVYITQNERKEPIGLQWYAVESSTIERDSLRVPFGSRLVVARVSLDGHSAVHVWNSDQEWQTDATAKLSNGAVVSTSDRSFQPEILPIADKSGNYQVKFNLPASSANRESMVVVDGLHSIEQTICPLFATGPASCLIREENGKPSERHRIELRSRRLRHFAFLNIPLTPRPAVTTEDKNVRRMVVTSLSQKPGDVSESKDNLLTWRQVAQGDTATLDDGSKIKFLGVFDESDIGAGGWTLAGRRTKQLLPGRVPIYPGSPPSLGYLRSDRRRVIFSFVFPGKTQQWDLALFDSLKPEVKLISSQGASLHCSGNPCNFQTFDLPKNRQTIGLIVGYPFGPFRIIDRQLPHRYVASSPGMKGGAMVVNLPVSVSRVTANMDTEITLRNKHGNAVVYDLCSRIIGSNTIRFGLDHDKASQVVSAEIAARPYRYIEFPSIPLYPK